MDISEFKNFIYEIDKRLKEKRKLLWQSDIEGTYARALKLFEESGELSAEILSYFWDQRQEKLQNSSKENLSEEFADVIITTFLLAQSFDIDIFEAIQKKKEKIQARGGI